MPVIAIACPDSLTYEYRDRTLRVTAVKNLEDTHV